MSNPFKGAVRRGLNFRFVLWACIACLLAACGADRPSPQQPQKEKGFRSSAKVRPDRPAKPDMSPEEKRAARIDNEFKNIWWNKKVVIDALNLSQKQRDDMDARLLRFFEDGRKIQEEKVGLRKTVPEVMVRHEFDRGRQLIQEMGELDLQRNLAHFDLSLDVLKMLEPAQLETLTKQYPHLLQKFWVKLPPLEE